MEGWIAGAGGRERRNGKLVFNGYGDLFRVNEKALEMDGGNSCTRV